MRDLTKEPLRFAVIGAGFWSGFQIPGWLESPYVKLTGIYDPDLAVAQARATQFGAEHVTTSVEQLLQLEDLDFVDIITPPATHADLIRKAADAGVHVVCQKPLTDSYSSSEEVVEYCRQRRVQLLVNENFRWQVPIRRIKALIDQGVIGDIFRARLSFCSAFPVFDNQPLLKKLEHFILADIGVHILDMCRFLLGEVESLFCTTSRVNPEIAGEDVATVHLKMESGVHCLAEMSYASILEHEVFPETLMLVEGSQGSIQLLPGNKIRITTRQRTTEEICQIPMYPWVDPAYALVHSSIVATQQNLIKGLAGGQAETNGEDNLKTLRLVWGSYASADQGTSIKLDQFSM